MQKLEDDRWELFFDTSFYHMWAVRPVGDENFDSPHLFHFAKKEDAEKFKELIETSVYSTIV